MYLRIAGMMTASAVVIKLLLYLMSLEQERMAMFSIFAYLLIILVGCFFTLRKFKIENKEGIFKNEVKAGMKTTTLFALFFSIFTFVYYRYVDTHYFPSMIEDRVAIAESELENNPDIDLENVRKTGELFFSPKTHATITLFGLTATGAIYSVLLVIFMRRMPGFR